MITALLNPADWYADLVDQGYTAEHAARRSGYTPASTPVARPVLALVPTPPAGLEPAPVELEPETKHYRIFPSIPDAPSGGTEWRLDALCAEIDSEIFFPEKGQSSRSAKKVCAMCEVRPECLAYALESNQGFGIWGGLSVMERRKL